MMLVDMHPRSNCKMTPLKKGQPREEDRYRSLKDERLLMCRPRRSYTTIQRQEFAD